MFIDQFRNIPPSPTRNQNSDMIFLFSPQESVYIHSSLTDLHEHMDPEILPEEFGGKAGTFDNAPIKELTQKRISFGWPDSHLN